MRRVAVTGLGAVSAFGHGVDALDQGLRAGCSAIRPLTLFDTSRFRTRFAAQAPEPAIDEGACPQASRPDRFGIEAALEAVRQAGLAPEHLLRAACIFGTGTGGAPETEKYLASWLEGGDEASDPKLLVSHQPASVTDVTAAHLGIEGPRNTIMTACSSSASAVGHAGDLIRLGRVDVALAGGAEGICRLTFAGFHALRALSPEPCRPFDAERKGITLGEGAAALVLEAEEHARRRGAVILGFLSGFGMSADAYHMTAPHPDGDGGARAMRAALDDARLSADAIGYVNAHGTGTTHNDLAEALALHRVFGARARRIPVSSTKSLVGHTLGAAGAIEAVISLLALGGGYLPPTAHTAQLDPAIDLDLIRGSARPSQVEAVLSSSFAFGGNNSALVFTRS